ncbi:MAG: hypothetical protein KJZ87_05060, partial [Thermoguttaceae bacterium]|nr:hypothetical protein [Thermoguttaceae bacterium]
MNVFLPLDLAKNQAMFDSGPDSSGVVWLDSIADAVRDSRCRLKPGEALLAIRLITEHASTAFSVKPGSRWSPLLPYQA